MGKPFGIWDVVSHFLLWLSLLCWQFHDAPNLTWIADPRKIIFDPLMSKGCERWGTILNETSNLSGWNRNVIASILVKRSTHCIQIDAISTYLGVKLWEWGILDWFSCFKDTKQGSTSHDTTASTWRLQCNWLRLSFLLASKQLLHSWRSNSFYNPYYIEHSKNDNSIHFHHIMQAWMGEELKAMFATLLGSQLVSSMVDT